MTVLNHDNLQEKVLKGNPGSPL